MKKTLIAVAALVATGAFAQSTVSLDGVFDAGLVSNNYKGNTVTGVGGNISTTSQVNFRATNDLGGGLKASFRVETDWSTVTNAGNTGAAGATYNTSGVANGSAANGGSAGTAYPGAAASFGNGEVVLNLAGGFGKVGFGAINNLGLEQFLTSQPFGTAVGSGFRATGTSDANAGAGAAVRNDNTLRYDTPSFSGLSASWIARKQQAGVNTTTSTATTTGFGSFGAQAQGMINELGARYNAGPLNVLLARSVSDNTNVIGVNVTFPGTAAAGTAGTKGVLNMLAVNYNLGALTLMGGYQGQTSTNTAAVQTRNTTQFNVAATYTMGANMFMAQYARLSGFTSAANANNVTAAPLLGLGYEYALSKNTAIVARYERISNDLTLGVSTVAGINNGTGDTRTRLGAGLRMGF